MNDPTVVDESGAGDARPSQPEVFAETDPGSHAGRRVGDGGEEQVRRKRDGPLLRIRDSGGCAYAWIVQRIDGNAACELGQQRRQRLRRVEQVEADDAVVDREERSDLTLNG